MMPLWHAPAVLLSLLSWMAAPPSSLLEAANREALRRQLTAKAASSFTNQDLPEARLVVTMTPPDSPPPAQAVITPPPPPTAAPEAPATPARDEQWWRDRVASARTSLERNQVLAEAMQSRVNGLQTDFANRDDPAQREELRRQLQRALNELDRLKQSIARDEQSIKDIQTEARRNRIPPGWIR